ncbi:MAG TPA: cyclic 2,3-diphosphoglycerate synthase [Thermodesulfobacteriota bacterium]|nr:cyclic 2,3-diphosphoglycerate synthase [Thermodesulfobacteriota bacterium]
MRNIPEKRKRVVIMGAAGRDFHNFNVVFRDKKEYEVIAFTAAQIPNIEKRIYPSELSGRLYPKGIPIYPESELKDILVKKSVNEVVLAYSDLSNEEVMEKASIVLSSGADFKLMGPHCTMLKSKRPVIAVCAVRTGVGKGVTTRKTVKILMAKGFNVLVVRHPMPYGDLRKQISQRFSSYEDLEKNNCTLEEIEEYEPHIREGTVVYAGIDYAKILKEAEKEAEIIVWDGGNNDLPFFKPDLHIVIADARRAGHEVSYFPGQANLMMADIVIINKVKTAKKKDVLKIKENVRRLNPKAVVIMADMPKHVDKPKLIMNKRVVVIEDGPTLTHGGLSFGAGTLEARRLKARIIDPRPYAVKSIKEVYEKYPNIWKVLPAVGYGKEQIRDLEETINRAPCDSVLIGTPIDLGRYIKINKPYARVTYEIKELGKPDLEEIINEFVSRLSKHKKVGVRA